MSECIALFIQKGSIKNTLIVACNILSWNDNRDKGNIREMTTSKNHLKKPQACSWYCLQVSGVILNIIALTRKLTQTAKYAIFLIGERAAASY